VYGAKMRFAPTAASSSGRHGGRVGTDWAPEPLACAECGRPPEPDEKAEGDWRAYSDELGELHVLLPGLLPPRFR
jgi:hypothetical protein